MITIVDYGMGNLNSVKNMLKRIGVPARIASDAASIESAEKLILPGVGAFDPAMRKIRDAGLGDPLRAKARAGKTPILGICLGMQLLTEGSDEGTEPGFGWIPGRTRAFRGRIPEALKIPHMGWNETNARRPSPLVAGLETGARFYFVHSYYVDCADPADRVMTTRYGIDFDSVVQRGNVFGAQFHPEKSHRFGMRLLKNFAEIGPC